MPDSARPDVSAPGPLTSTQIPPQTLVQTPAPGAVPAAAPDPDAGGLPPGVGLTALLVAAARAIEAHRPDALAVDRFAEHFVRAAPATAGWPVTPAQVPGGDADPVWGRLGGYFALRTRVLDDYLRRCVRQFGLRQVVLLGAGLDTRAYRLGWPPDCTAYELDTAEMLAFKQQVLTALGAAPQATRVLVPVDLRDDWPAALRAAGFDPTVPTAWLAEGVLLYLPATAERQLISAVDRLSAPDSTLAYEAKLGSTAQEARQSPVYRETKERVGLDLLALFDAEPRPDSSADLSARDWSTAVRTPFDYSRRLGRGPLPEPRDALATNRWVFAHRPTTTTEPLF